MCSRFSQPYRIALKAKWDKINNPRKLPVFEEARYNIAPTDETLVITYKNGEIEVDQMIFGLIPHWAKDIKMGLNCINARSETVNVKPSFREPFKHRRCVIPADGFFEWQREGKTKKPYRFVLKNGEPLALAGLWDEWVSPFGQTVKSFCVITTEPNDLMAQIHDRMPVILSPEQEDEWLHSKNPDPTTLLRLLKPYPSEGMTRYRVSEIMNSSKNKGPECIQPV